jgi:hypothetical protein
VAVALEVGVRSEGGHLGLDPGRDLGDVGTGVGVAGDAEREVAVVREDGDRAPALSRPT